MSNTQLADIPKWSALLVEGVNKPGLILEAYSAFRNYSLGNQLLALVQCHMRGIQPGPIHTFPKWQALGRHVKRGERALILCMPITRKRRDEEANTNDEAEGEHTYTSFVHRARWFVLSQTEGQELAATSIPQWDAGLALATLNIERIAFDSTDGNCQGFARKRQIAINPMAQLPYKTLFHEAAHVTLGHTAEGDFADGDATPRSLREVEAEAVALLCCESLGLEGADYCRGYIQNWLYRRVGLTRLRSPKRAPRRFSAPPIKSSAPDAHSPSKRGKASSKAG